MQSAAQEIRYLCVDRFMQDAVSARALASAFETGVIDSLIQHPGCSFDTLNAQVKIEPRGLRLLLDLLRASRVIEHGDRALTLSTPFVEALQYRDLLETKLYFADLVAPDFFNRFTTLIADPRRFFEQARIFDLFSYQRCFQPSDENYALTARWMRITTVLTKYEAAACLNRYDFSKHRRQLDVGGNSGEFALRICKAHPELHATVLDLPLVCDIGARHLSAEPEADRIGFIKTAGTGEAMPAGFDLITFKSMLHDWPDAEIGEFLAKAYDALVPGGTLLIFERSRFEVGDTLPLYCNIPLLLFFRSYRAPEAYKICLEKLGFRDIAIMEFQLEMPFVLITATK